MSRRSDADPLTNAPSDDTYDVLADVEYTLAEAIENHDMGEVHALYLRVKEYRHGPA